MTKENLPEEKLLRLIRLKKTDKEKQPSRSLAQTKRSFDVKAFLGIVNGILTIAALGLTGFLIYHLFFVLNEKKNIVLDTPAPVKAEAVESRQVVFEKKPFEYYKNQFAKRDLFERPLDQVAANASSDLTKRYKLVGIVLGEIPEAIVEDLTTKNTMFVHEGERLDAVEVKKIEEGRIIFLQEGLEIELKQ